jgi:hypothetical protein
MSSPCYIVVAPEPSSPIDDFLFNEEEINQRFRPIDENFDGFYLLDEDEDEEEEDDETTQGFIPIDETSLEVAMMLANNMVVQRTNELANIIAERDANENENPDLNVIGYENSLEEAIELVGLIQRIIDSNHPP